MSRLLLTVGKFSQVISEIILAMFFATILAWNAFAQVPSASLQYRAQLTREAQHIFGLNAPVPVLAAQIEQESGWRPSVTAWDNGRGMAQFMDPTAQWVSAKYPELGRPDPYNPAWAMRAMIRLNGHNLARVEGSNSCEKWGAALKAYNAGLGYVQRAQKSSLRPTQWFGLTEYIQTGQSAKNFEYSRMYPRWILFQRQPKYPWGPRECL